MKKLLFILLSTVYLFNTTFAQEKTDSVTTEPIKKGWNFGILPALGYDSNLGLLYGGILNMFDYGNGERYPDFNHNLYLQLSSYTKGGIDGILFFDSYTLIPNKHFTGRLSYSRNRAFPFYGFNGKQTVYNEDFIDNEKEAFLSQVFYKYDRSVVKGDLILQDDIGDTDFKWLAGFDLAHYSTGSVDIDHLNKGKSGEDVIVDTALLYDRFVEWSIIPDEEKEGGFDNSIKLGVVYDTRDRITNPMKGTWTEVLVRTAPSFLGNYNNFMRMSIIHRQYFTLKKERLSFAYRLWYEAAFGEVPYYSRPYLTASNYYEGLGGASNLRGAVMNRVVGRQIAFANLELRWKAIRFNWIKQNFYLGMNLFSDAGYVIEGYDMDLSLVSNGDQNAFFNTDYKEVIQTLGAGLKLVMNENFVVSADFAKAFDKNYGTTGLYVQIGYLF